MPTPYEAELLNLSKTVTFKSRLNNEETQLLFTAAKSDTKLMDNAFDVADAQGGKSCSIGLEPHR